MAEIISKVREWGRSLGIVIPKNLAEKSHLKSGDEVKIVVLKKQNVLKQTFGITSFSRSTEKILKEIDKEAWNE